MTQTFAHALPFGAECREDGRVRFRIWAPSVPALRLAIEGGGATSLDMDAVGDGWFECTTERAGPGTRYRYELPDGLRVPDPASRFQPEDVNGPSEVVDPRAYAWRTGAWRGRRWEDAVLYELHVGAFTGLERGGGTFDAARRRLDHLADLGVTALQIMPIGDFAGRRNWGYDGVLPFAPDSSYGRPDDLKRLVDEAHERDLMVFLDVVYNHFGPEGNHLNAYARSFFTERHHTPWGAAINFDGPDSRPVRDFFVHNALYWLREYRFDGLRLDAVHAIIDDGTPDILTELAERVRREIGEEEGREVHLVLENEANAAHRLERGPGGRPRWYTAQWNDDYHHVFHVLLTGESASYYGSYAGDVSARTARALAEGFVYQGEPMPHAEPPHPRGEPSAHLPPAAFVSFLQNHDQVGNRAFGERLGMLAEDRALRTVTAVFLLGPHPPMLFMGEEWRAAQPFLFFCDFHGGLADAVRDGRRREFARFPEFSDPGMRVRIPDPNAEETYLRSCLDWEDAVLPRHREWLELHRELLRIRREDVAPRLAGMSNAETAVVTWGGGALRATWRLGDGSRLCLLANLGDGTREGFEFPPGELLFESERRLSAELAQGRLPGWTAAWFLERARGA